MMRTALFLLMANLMWMEVTAQTIRIADNNANRPTGANIFSTVQAAVDAAVAGDIVYVQPSLTSYGDVTINKQITLRGIGFNTGKDLAFQSRLNNVSLTNRSDGTSNSSGTLIDGIAANDIYVGLRTGIFNYTLENVLITNCTINKIYRDSNTDTYQPIQNFTVTKSFLFIEFGKANVNQMLVYGNYLTGFVFGRSSTIGGGPSSVSNLIISNNIVAQGSNNGIIVSNTSVANLIITNNNFLGGTNIAGSRFIGDPQCCWIFHTIGLADALVSNNIFFGAAPNSGGGGFERNVFTNNLSFGTTNNTLPPAGSGAGNTGTGNIENQDPLFVNAPYNAAYTATMDFRLQTSSPAKNAGSDGTDIGITGGAYPVTAGNILLKPTSAPVIMQFNPAALVPQNQPVKANIKANSN